MAAKRWGWHTWKHSIISPATAHVMLCDLRMNMNLCHFSALVSASCSSSCWDRAASFCCRPVVSGEPSRPAVVTSCIKAEEVTHIKAGRRKRRRRASVRLWTSSAPICVTKLQLADIRTLDGVRRGGFLLSLSSRLVFVFRWIVPA